MTIEDLYDMYFGAKNMYEKYPESNGTNALFYMLNEKGEKERVKIHLDRSWNDREITIEIEKY